MLVHTNICPSHTPHTYTHTRVRVRACWASFGAFVRTPEGIEMRVSSEGIGWQLEPIVAQRPQHIPTERVCANIDWGARASC